MTSKTFKRITLPIAMIALGVFLYVAYQPKPVQVDLAPVEFGEVQVTIDEDGQARVKDRYIVRAPLSATMTRVQLHPGDTVEPQQHLAGLAPITPALLDARSMAEARARVAAATAARRQALSLVEKARGAAQFAEKEYTRRKALADKGTLSTANVQRAAFDLSSSRADLSSAEFAAKVSTHQLEMAKVATGVKASKGPTRQADVTLTSPIAGTVLAVLERGGGVVSVGTPVIELGDSSALEIVVDVLTADAVRLQLGGKVRISQWGGEQALAGHIRLIEPRAFTRVSSLGVQEQRVNVIVDLDSPRTQWQALGDGYRVEAQLLVNTSEHTLRIPESAVFKQGSTWATFVHRDDQVFLTKITVGLRNATWVEVSGGLKENEQVILHPSDRIYDGQQAVPRRK